MQCIFRTIINKKLQTISLHDNQNEGDGVRLLAIFSGGHIAQYPLLNRQFVEFHLNIKDCTPMKVLREGFPILSKQGLKFGLRNLVFLRKEPSSCSLKELGVFHYSKRLFTFKVS